MKANIYASSIVKHAIPPQVATDDTAIVSSIIDTKGWSYLEWVLNFGTLADADVTSTVLIEGSNDSGMSGAAAVPDEALENTEAGAAVQFDDDLEIRKIGVKRLDYRYYQLTFTPSNNTGNLPISCTARLNGNTYEGVTQPEA